jgi:hypothetical protein
MTNRALENSPFFVRGVSYHDIVRVIPSNDGSGLEFAGVIDRSGHSTYMLLVLPISSSFDEYWKRLENLGCTYESGTIGTAHGERLLYSVDVPAESDVYQVYPILEEGERTGVWLFQEGHVGHKLKPESG